MPLRSPLFALALGLLFTACAPPAQPASPAIDLAAEERAIHALSEEYTALYAARDSSALAAMFADDAMTAYAGEAPARGPAAIVANMRQAWADNPKMQLVVATEHVWVSGAGDMAGEIGSWAYQNLGPDGTGTDQGTYVTLWRKVGGAWKIQVDSSSSAPVPAM